MKKRITIFVTNTYRENELLELKLWFKKWGNDIYIEQYLKDNDHHIWDLEAPMEAINDLSKNWLCENSWSNIEAIN